MTISYYISLTSFLYVPFVPLSLNLVHYYKDERVLDRPAQPKSISTVIYTPNGSVLHNLNSARIKIMDSLNRLEQGVVRFGREIGRTFQAIDWRLDPKASSARQELLKLKSAIAVDINNLPATLRIEAGEEEYFSIRRIEGDQLYRKEDSHDVYDSKTIFGIPATTIPDGVIGVLIIPNRAKCQNEELSQRYPDNTFSGWVFEAAMADGIPYQRKDWEIKNGSPILISRKGDNVYLLGGTELLGQRTIDKFDEQDIISLLKPDKDGKLNLHEEAQYLSPTERDTKRRWYSNMTRLYVMVRGSGETKKTDKLPPIKTRQVATAQI